MRTAPANQPCHRAIVALDIAGSTMRTDTAKIQLRRDLYDLFEVALATAGITDDCRDPLIDRGDGILALIHPVDQVPKTLLLNTLTPALGSLLEEHAAQYPNRQFRLRLVIHAGEVYYDRRGPFGEALDIAFRLLDAGEVRGQLQETLAPMVLVVSDAIYQSIVRHQDGDDGEFESAVSVWLAGQRQVGWMRVPAAAEPAMAGNSIPLRANVALAPPRPRALRWSAR